MLLGHTQKVCGVGLTKQTRRAYFKKYYAKNRDDILEDVKSKSTPQSRKASNRARYMKNSKKILRSAHKKHLLLGEKRKEAERVRYASHADETKLIRNVRYASQSEIEKEARRERYVSHPNKEKEARRVRYVSHPDKEKEARRVRYVSHPDKEKEARRVRDVSHPDKEKEARRARYVSHPDKEKEARRVRYVSHSDKEKEARRLRYVAHSDKEKEARRVRYVSDPDKEKKARRVRYVSRPKERESRKVRYMSQSDKEKEARRIRYASQSDKENISKRIHYASNSTQKIAATKQYYRSHLHEQKCAMKNRYTRCHALTLQMRQHAYYDDTKSRKAAVLVRRAAQCMQKKAKRESPRALNSLSEPSQYSRELYIKAMKDNISSDASLKEKLVNTFYSCRCDVEKTNSESMANAVLSMAARRVLQTALKIRKEQAGELIKSARSIDVLQIPDESNWERCHTATSEPYFYDQSYTQVKRDGPICIDGKGICYIAKEIGEWKYDAGRPKKWSCTSECKVLTVEECKSIVNLKAIFQERMPSLKASFGGY